MDSDNIVLDEETILNNMKKMFTGNWNDILDYYEKVVKCGISDYYSVCDKAALNGHLEVLKYAHENGCPWNWRTCGYVAIIGHLEILKYAYENGCPWNEDTCSCAAACGHLEILKYARDNGCRWNGWACTWAALNGHLDILYYLYENEAPYGIFAGIHPNCKEFFNTFGEYWKNGDFSLMHNLKPAKNN